jgi:hypothetical protein
VKPECEFWDPFSDEYADRWTPIEGVEGLSEIVLGRDEETGSYSRLLRFEAGADTSPLGVQSHDFIEEILIFEGSIHDLTLGETFGRGYWAHRHPDMPHGPWTSEDGCITFEVRTYV